MIPISYVDKSIHYAAAYTSPYSAVIASGTTARAQWSRNDPPSLDSPLKACLSKPISASVNTTSFPPASASSQLIVVATVFGPVPSVSVFGNSL